MSVPMGSEADEDIPDQRVDEPGLSTENEVDIVDNELNEAVELQEQERTENEYVGLDKVAMEAEKILRCSDEDLYTLLDGQPSRHQAQVGANNEAAGGQHESEDESDGYIARSDTLEKKEFEGKTEDLAEDCDTAKETNDDETGFDALEKKECEGKTKVLGEDCDTVEETYDDVAGIFEEGAVRGLLLQSATVIGDDLTRFDEPDHTYLEVIGGKDEQAGLQGSHQQDSSDEDPCEYSYAYTGPRGKFMNRPEKSNRKVIIFKTIE